MKGRTKLLGMALATSLSLLIGGLSAESYRGDCYNCCTAYNACGEFHFRADYLYWRPCTDGEVCALRQKRLTTFTSTGGMDSQALSSANTTDRFKKPNDRWHSGFRLGFGYRPTCKCYDVALHWINYEPHRSCKAVADDDFIVTPFPGYVLEKDLIVEFVDGGNFIVEQLAELQGKEVRGKWNLCLNLVDLEFGYRLHCGDCFAFRPHAGLRYASIDQHLKVNTEGEIICFVENPPIDPFCSGMFSSEKHFKSDFCGVGPRVGFTSSYAIGCDWGIYGNLALSLLYGDRDSSHKEEASRFDVERGTMEIEELDSNDFSLNRKMSRYCTSALTDAELGLFWNHRYCYCNSVYDFTFTIGWEHHYFFNQSAIDIARGSPLFKEENGDLSTQGLTVSFGIAF